MKAYLAIVPIAVRRETRGSSKENRGHALGTDGESERDDGIDVATGRRGKSLAYKSYVDQRLTLNFFQASFIPHRDDTHSTQRSSTDFINHNAFDFSNVESEVEEEGDWHDDLTSKENPGPSMRVSEAMSSEVRSTQLDDSSLIYYYYSGPHGGQTVSRHRVPPARTREGAVTR